MQKKQGFKLNKIKQPIYIYNIDDTFNKKKLIEYIVKVNIFYRKHRERTKINVIEEQKFNIILEIPWLACYNLEINWKTREVKMIRCPKECRR